MKKNLQKHVHPSLILVIIGILLSMAAGIHLFLVLDHQQTADLEKISTIYTERTETLINSYFHKTDILAAVVKLKNGVVSDEEFNTMAQMVYQENAGIRGIQLMPDAIVTNSYPVEGNEAVIGKNFLEIPERKKDVLLAIDTKSIALSGPYELLQGGLGVVARNPIFLKDDTGKEYFWGFTAIVLDLPDALASAQLDHLNDSGYNFQLFNVNENGERLVIAGNENMDTDKAYCSGVSVPNHEWTLAISEKRPWAPMIAGGGTFLLGLLLTVALWNVARLVRKEKEAVTAKDEFFSNISHDMRTPLNAVLGFTNLALQPGLSTSEKNDYLQKIESSGNLLLELVNDTLLLSKGSNGKLQMQPEAVSLYELGRSILSPLRQLAKNKDIQLNVENHLEKDSNVLVDKLYVEKIFLNLITNAIKYTPAGGHVWITIQPQPTDSDHVGILVTIKDDGIGMSEEFQKKMFEPFEQENRSGYESNGTGLGLAIVKQTVDMLHGTILVHSVENEGTEFTVGLQFAMVQGTEVLSEASTNADTSRLSGKKILVCEDNALNLEIAKALLETKGMQVETAGNGEIGVEVFSSHPENTFAAILMDLRMPVKDGIEAAETIRSLKRKDASRIPIIAMTADVFQDDIQKCHEAGMNAHVAKPINPELLYETLLQYIQEPNEK